MNSPRNDESMKKILRSLKNVNNSTQSNETGNNLKQKELSSSCSSSSIQSKNKFQHQNESSRIKSDKISIQNMIKSHPLLIDLNQSKEKSIEMNDTKQSQNKQKSIVEYDQSSDEMNLNKIESEEDEDDDVINNLTDLNDLNNNFNNNNQLNYYSYDTDLSDVNKKNCTKQNRDYYNNCNNKPRCKSIKSDCTRIKLKSKCNQDPICSSEQVKKKLHRANKVFYNGYLNKQDNKNIHLPEYQSHATELLHFLKSLWLSNTMCDLSIVVGNRKYPAHRLGLAMFSRKYRDEFQKKIQNKDTGVYTICLKNTTNFAIEAILKYIYTAKIDINPANVEEILSAAKELGIDDLICMANDYLSSLSIGDVLDYMGNILNKEGSELMFYELYAYMMTHLDKISRTPEYLKSSICVVKALLGDSHLSVCNEIEVFEAALRWLDYDKPNRFKYLYDLMINVRFTLITPDELVSKIENTINLNENHEIFKLVYNGYKFHSLNNVQSKLNNFIKREECRNICLKGASVPDAFVKAIIELTEIAHKLKAARAFTSNKLLD